MVLWKPWLELRGKFYLSLLVVGLTIGASVPLAAWVSRDARTCQPQEEDCDPEETSPFESMVESYSDGAQAGSLYLLVIVLAVGGMLSESRGRLALLTASLPVRHHTWLLGQAAVVGMLAFLVTGALFLEISIVAMIAGFDLDLGLLATGMLGMAVASLIWIWPAMLATWFTGDGVKAAIATVALLIGMAYLDDRTSSAWHPFRLADPIGWDGFPLPALIVAAAIIGVTGLAMVRLIERSDL